MVHRLYADEYNVNEIFANLYCIARWRRIVIKTQPYNDHVWCEYDLPLPTTDSTAWLNFSFYGKVNRSTCFLILHDWDNNILLLWRNVFGISINLYQVFTHLHVKRVHVLDLWAIKVWMSPDFVFAMAVLWLQVHSLLTSSVLHLHINHFTSSCVPRDIIHYIE